MHLKFQFGLTALASTLGAVTAAHGAEIYSTSVSLTSGNYSASADFSVDNGGTLTVQVTNTMTVWDANAWLTGVFFNIQGATVTGLQTATGDSQEHFDPAGDDNGYWHDTPAGANNTVTGEWDSTSLSMGWASGFLSAFGDANYGIGSAGLGVFDGMQVDGPPGGLVPTLSVIDASDGIPNNGLDSFPNNDQENFTIETITFVLGLDNIVPNDLEITDIGFFFGTGAEDAVVLIPLPPALPLGLAGLAGVAFMRRRITRGKRVA